MELSRIKEFAKEWGFADVEFLIEWRGYDVYDGILAPEKEGRYIGLPRFILSNDQEIRMTEFPNEYNEIADIVYPREEEDAEEEDEYRLET